MPNDINVRFRMWIDVKNSPYLGLGRIILLENIIKHGSITKGAEAINMSYRKAWQLIEDMNKLSRKPLVIKKIGGKHGGGAEVTNEGKKTIHNFYKLQKDVEEYVKERISKIY